MQEVADEGSEGEGEEETIPSVKKGAPEPKKTYSKDKVRMSQADRTLDSMFPVLHPSTQPSPPEKGDLKYRKGKEKEVEIPESTTQSPTWIKAQEIEESECFLTSVNKLRKTIQKAKHNRKVYIILKKIVFVDECIVDFTEILQQHVFVGIVDLRPSLSLLQHSTKLYLVNHASLACVHLSSSYCPSYVKSISEKSFSINWVYASLGTFDG